MSRIRKTPTSADNLYPVVQDLTETEYGTGAFCGGMLGSFALEDLAFPIANARSLPSTPEPSKRKQHNRGHSLFQLPSAMSRFASSTTHKRSSSAPNEVESCPTDETLQTTDSSDNAHELEAEETTTSFDDAFVLTRQVRFMIFDDRSIC
jgi:hypothetical protein